MNIGDDVKREAKKLRGAGILTMCHASDWHKAIGLALSVRARCPGLPIAVVRPPSLHGRLSPYFDVYIDEIPGLRGFSHKLHLDQYSPFEKTLFLDADMLAMRDLRLLMAHWSGCDFTARGRLLDGGISNFGLDRRVVLCRLGKPRFSCVDGAGHYYFESPNCNAVFSRAREILGEYSRWAPGARVADEDLLGIVMTERGIHPFACGKQVVGFVKAMRGRAIGVDLLKGRCSYVDLAGDHVEPFLLHFAYNMSPIFYHNLLRKFSDAHDGPADVNWRLIGLKEFAHYTMWWGAKARVRRLLGPRR